MEVSGRLGLARLVIVIVRVRKAGFSDLAATFSERKDAKAAGSEHDWEEPTRRERDYRKTQRERSHRGIRMISSREERLKTKLYVTKTVRLLCSKACLRGLRRAEAGVFPPLTEA